MNKGKISIILPALNEAETIGKVIDEIPRETLVQDGYRVEVLVVDNGSTDQTARIAREKGWCDFDAVADGISEKMTRRHPHVFGETEVEGAGEVVRNWEAIKRQERGGDSKTSVLDGVPTSLPALLKAYRMTQKAAAVGFDWERPADVIEKLQEEVSELEAEVRAGDEASLDRIRSEMGDVLFVMANLALALYVVLLIGYLSLFNVTLTLPGIAGAILSIGMAIDANIIIFERLKEELAWGKTLAAAIEAAFARAWIAILDGNLTTLIAALFLFQFGTGPVKGFAVTLTIGILASMFTAVFVSRTLYMIILAGKDRVESLSI